MMNTKRDILIRVYLSFLFFIALAITVMFQIMKVQFKEGKYWRSLSDSLTTSYRTIEAIRGNIYSDDGKLLVTSLPIYELHIDFKASSWQNNDYFKQNIDSFCVLTSALFNDVAPQEYKRKILIAKNRGQRYYLFKRNVNHNFLKTLKTFPFLREGKFKGGLIVEQKSRRIHPFRLLAERTIGYNTPGVKPVGLEGSYDEYLSGKTGRRLMQKISGGNWIPINYDNEIEPEDGKDIVTTLDIGLQDVAENALLKSLVAHEADYGCVVVMEVKTGYIKAIANLKKTKNGDYTEQYNYAVGAATEPGSTFKLVSSLILLENANVKLNDVIDTKNGEVKFYDRVMRDAGENGYGKITFKEAFELSSNVAFSTLVNNNFNNKPSQYINYIKELGLHKTTGCEIPGEGTPVFKQPGKAGWSGISLPWMSVGYELQITPLQLLTFYNGIANDGVMVKPIFVKEIRNVGKLVEKFEPVILNDHLCSKKTNELLKTMMEGVVKNGTAKNIRSEQYKIAGKTGTALVADKGSYSRAKVYQASFAGYFPADNPKYSCIVVISNPRSGQIYGSSVAAPVFKEISDKIYVEELRPYIFHQNNHQNLDNIQIVRFGNKKDLITLSTELGITMKVNSTGSDWVRIVPEEEKLNLYNKPLSAQFVPDVRGMVLSDALPLLENMGLKVISAGFGKVSEQSLEPGTRFYSRTIIKLRLS